MHVATAVCRTQVGGGAGGLGNLATSPTRAATSSEQASPIPALRGTEDLTCWRLRSSPARTAGTFLRSPLHRPPQPCCRVKRSGVSSSVCAWGSWVRADPRWPRSPERRAAWATRWVSPPGPAAPPSAPCAVRGHPTCDSCVLAGPRRASAHGPHALGPSSSGHPPRGQACSSHGFHFNALAFSTRFHTRFIHTRAGP